MELYCVKTTSVFQETAGLISTQIECDSKLLEIGKKQRVTGFTLCIRGEEEPKLHKLVFVFTVDGCKIVKKVRITFD